MSLVLLMFPLMSGEVYGGRNKHTKATKKRGRSPANDTCKGMDRHMHVALDLPPLVQRFVFQRCSKVKKGVRVNWTKLPKRQEGEIKHNVTQQIKFLALFSVKKYKKNPKERPRQHTHQT